MFDKTEKIDNSLIQHGPFSDRVYLMKLSHSDMPGIISKLEAIARENNYGKIIAKVPVDFKNDFRNAGYKPEANIPLFYSGVGETVFMAKYNSAERKTVENEKEINDCLEIVNSKDKNISKWQKHPFEIRLIEKDELGQLSELYKKVFESYPFPIFDPEYLSETMDDNIKYFGAFDASKNKELVAAASSEMDVKNQNVEMTDFATLPEYRGKNLASSLLLEMEIEMKKIGIKTAYTIARAKSVGMNLVFFRQYYEFSGTLFNNTNICGQIESMNIWHKSLCR